MTLRGLGFEHGFHGIHGWTGALWGMEPRILRIKRIGLRPVFRPSSAEDENNVKIFGASTETSYLCKV